MKTDRNRKWLMGSFTVEMSVIVPLALFLILGCILVFFYYHDKNILAGAAYETAVVGSTKAREEEGVDPAELEELFQERIRGKCILFSGGKADVEITEEEITVRVSAGRTGMRISLVYKAAVTTPEEDIRNRKRLTG